MPLLTPDDTAEIKAFTPIVLALGALHQLGTLTRAALFPGPGAYHLTLTPAQQAICLATEVVFLATALLSYAHNHRTGVY